MRATRRAGMIALLGLVVTAGCIGFLTGSEALSFESEAASVGESALSETGYELERSTAQELSRNFTAAGQTREVEVTNHLTEYKRQVDFGPLGEVELARFVALTTPKVEVAGRTFNPVGDLSNRELVARFQGEYEGIRDVQPAGERTAPVFGEDATVSTFDAEATVEGRSIPIRIHVTKVEHGDDFVIAVGVHPRAIDERGRIDALLRGLSHPE